MLSTPTEKSSGLHSATRCAFYLLEHIHQELKEKGGNNRGKPNADKDITSFNELLRRRWAFF